MPRTPIQSRELYYDVLPDGSFTLLDWCLVNTSLGAMIEPRPLVEVRPKGQARNLTDTSFTRIQPMPEVELYARFNVSGRQAPINLRG